MTEIRTFDGRIEQTPSITPVRCGGCDTRFFVQKGPEFMPHFCCYCGVGFYTDVFGTCDGDVDKFLRPIPKEKSQ